MLPRLPGRQWSGWWPSCRSTHSVSRAWSAPTPAESGLPQDGTSCTWPAAVLWVSRVQYTAVQYTVYTVQFAVVYCSMLYILYSLLYILYSLLQYSITAEYTLEYSFSFSAAVCVCFLQELSGRTLFQEEPSQPPGGPSSHLQLCLTEKVTHLYTSHTCALHTDLWTSEPPPHT